MKAVTWQGFRDISVEEVADPVIKEPNDAIIKVTSTNICGSDLHLYETMGAFMSPVTYWAMRRSASCWRSVATSLDPSRRSGGRPSRSRAATAGCASAGSTQCETTQVRGEGSGAALFGYSKLYGQVPGAQAEYLRVPEAQFTHILVPDGPPDDRFVYLSDVLPTAWQGGGVRRRARRWLAARPGPRADRRHGLPDRPAEVDRQDHRGGPGG